MSEITKSIRHRVNVSRTSTGKYAWDCTVEYGTSQVKTVADDAQTIETMVKAMSSGEFDRTVSLALTDDLIAELEQRYPCEIPAVKEK